jgi:hypothetical protein
MSSDFTPDERREIETWLDEAKNRASDMLDSGMKPHYITAGSRVWWLLTHKGTYEKPMFGTLPIFPMNPEAVEFPVSTEGIVRPINGIAVVARCK